MQAKDLVKSIIWNYFLKKLIRDLRYLIQFKSEFYRALSMNENMLNLADF